MAKKSPLMWLMLIQVAISLEWLHGAWDKFSSTNFIDNIGATLGFFASKNPHHGYADFLNNTAIPNATAFGELVRWGELGVGLILLLVALSSLLELKSKLPLGLIAGVTLILALVLNLNFYYASAWTGPASSSVNIVMGLVELVLAAYWLSDGYVTEAPKRARAKK